MTRKFPRPDSKGRSTAPMKDSRQGPAVWGGYWTSIGQDLLESFAWRAMSDLGRKVVDRIMLEHILHGGGQNGDLPVAYVDFAEYGLRKNSIALGIAEALALGLIERPERGRRSYGSFKGAPAIYRLPWFATRDGAPPTNRWKRFTSLAQAKAAAKAAREGVKATWNTRPSRKAPAKRRLETEVTSYATAAE